MALYVAAIYLTIPYGPQLWLKAGVLTGLAADSLALYALVTAGGMVSIVALQIFRLHTLLKLAVLAGIYVYLYGHVFQAPAEKLHLIEYGFLSWILWWAWRPDPLKISSAAAGVLLLNAAFGAIDELIQYATPGRVGEFRDVVINWGSAALGLAVLLTLTRHRELTTHQVLGA